MLYYLSLVYILLGRWCTRIWEKSLLTEILIVVRDALTFSVVRLMALILASRQPEPALLSASGRPHFRDKYIKTLAYNTVHSPAHKVAIPSQARFLEVIRSVCGQSSLRRTSTSASSFPWREAPECTESVLATIRCYVKAYQPFI